MHRVSTVDLHRNLNARFIELNGKTVPHHYGDPLLEYRWLHESVAVLDLSFRSRCCLTGADRQRFLNGQVTQNVQALKPGQGCYAALITAKGKMVSDLNIYVLPEEILLDFEPGMSQVVSERLEKYVIADDVQVVDVALPYLLLTIQGPRAGDLMRQVYPGTPLPESPFQFTTQTDSRFTDVYIANQPRTGLSGFDIFAPADAVPDLWSRCITAARELEGGPCGWQALEWARIEAGIPRFGVDMDESNLAPEAGIERRAISYTKGCYIGQEVISRIRTYGQVAKALRGLRFAQSMRQLPVKGDKILKDEKEAGYITSAIHSPRLDAQIALGYVRRECNEIGTRLRVRTSSGEETEAEIVGLPFIGTGS